MFRRIIPIVLVLALATLACGLNVSLPVGAVTPAPDVTDEILIPAPEGGGEVSLDLAFGAGELSLSPGGGESLVEGTATYNIPDFKPEITTEGSSVSIKQGEYKFTGFPNFDGVKNEWDLKLGETPLSLTIQGGAYKALYEFGGLSLTSLFVKDGASDVNMAFSLPNQAEMSLLRYETGASNVTLTGLGNANFNTMVFKGGAGNYRLDFSGAFRRDGTVTIETGISNFTLIIPEGVDVQVRVEGGLTNVSVPMGWAQDDSTYTRSGSGPKLTILVEIGAGNLTLSD
ncbi:MAG: hypothetical protein GXP40_08545 [Chloroflexi bacterium]|nr:hypothetical protein [Chloroflexota bacterium]